MILSTLIALAIAAEVPRKARPRNNPAWWVWRADLPSPGVATGVTTADLTIDKVGKPSRCAVVRKSGFETLDAAVCAALMKRARLWPAVGAGGDKVFSVNRIRVALENGPYTGNRYVENADIVITSPDVAAETGGLVEVRLGLDGLGAVSTCDVVKGSGKTQLDDLACRVSSKPDIATAITDPTGKTVPGLRTFFIGFRTGVVVSSELQ